MPKPDVVLKDVTSRVNAVLRGLRFKRTPRVSEVLTQSCEIASRSGSRRWAGCLPATN